MGFHYLWKSGGSVTWGINLCVAFLCAADRAVDEVRVGPTRPPEVFCAVAKPKIDGLLGMSKARTEAAA